MPKIVGHGQKENTQWLKQWPWLSFGPQNAVSILYIAKRLSSTLLSFAPPLSRTASTLSLSFARRDLKIDGGRAQHSRVPLHVLAQVIAAHEPIQADRANKLFFTGVSAEVARQLVRARKRLVARLPLANVRPFTRVNSNVRLQVRALKVLFATVVVRTHVIARLAVWRTVRAARRAGRREQRGHTSAAAAAALHALGLARRLRRSEVDELRGRLLGLCFGALLVVQMLACEAEFWMRLDVFAFGGRLRRLCRARLHAQLKENCFAIQNFKLTFTSKMLIVFVCCCLIVIVIASHQEEKAERGKMGNGAQMEEHAVCTRPGTQLQTAKRVKTNRCISLMALGV
ncbi:hypothetical protein BpHYR1_008701 [Brachionus plicatilis]|uniref:Uncharacterized protein n=1 Tax=Brachionus plicatilis TaxID=10195 RepID=A0A3M7TAY1_BRAPC|nr:hypothetical protein BpHYR1_008701 [Brachionus plicatilis]